MAPVTNTQVTFNDYPTGYPEPGKTVVINKTKTTDLDNEPLNGGILVKVLTMAIDPYTRGFMRREGSYRAGYKIGEPIFAGGIGKVIRSDNPSFCVGDHIYSFLPFAEYAILNDSEPVKKVEKLRALPWSTYLGICGMPGKTAHHGYKEFVKPHVKKGDTIFITSGAGPVARELLIQIAKLDGLKVIASAGSEDKVKFMKECGAYVAFNYKTTTTKEVLKDHGPINFYWDHVGGDPLDCALEAAAPFARFVICGLISSYNGPPQSLKNFAYVITKSLTINGFTVSSLSAKHDAAFTEFVPPKVGKGEFKYREDRRHGLDAVEQTLLDVQTGKNEGKAIIVVADDD